MVDIHCHILPGVDDGAYHLEESLEMARLAVRSGVTDIIATPHFQGNRAAMEGLGRILKKLELLRDALAQERIPLRVHPGVEILCLPQTLELARQKRLPTIGEGRYVLVEFYFDADAVFMDDALEELARCGYWPVVAHPERYGAVQRDLGLAQDWFDRGYVLQINKGSPLGAFGPRVQQTAAKMLRMGLAHILASDAHSAERRTTDMDKLVRWTAEHLGPGYTRILLEENPARILKGLPVVPTE